MIDNSNTAPMTQNPCYVQPFSEVFNEDCITVMKRYPDKFFDLAVVDPPYSDKFDTKVSTNNKAKKGEYRYSGLNNKMPKTDYFKELFRVSKNQIIWGGNYFKNLPSTQGWLVWKKMDIDNRFAPFEMAWTSMDKVKLFEYLWAGMWQQNMKDKEVRIHPTQKPVALYDWIFSQYAKEGNLILDTHLGSGSSRIAAHKHKLNFVGCELDEEYFVKQEARFKEFVSQLRLF